MKKSKLAVKTTNEQSTGQKKGQKKNILKDFSQELGLHLLKPKSKSTTNQVSTEDDSPHGVRVVVFNDPTKKPKKTVVEDVKDGNVEAMKVEKVQLMSLKKARYDVLKFGITGFDKQKKVASKEQIAIRLGAVPRKKTGINYKLFMQQRKEEILKERQTRVLKGKLGLKVKKPEPTKRPKDKNSVRDFDGQIGKYKDGFQVISKQDIKRIQQSGKRKKKS